MFLVAHIYAPVICMEYELLRPMSSHLIRRSCSTFGNRRVIRKTSQFRVLDFLAFCSVAYCLTSLGVHCSLFGRVAACIVSNALTAFTFDIHRSACVPVLVTGRYQRCGIPTSEFHCR